MAIQDANLTCAESLIAPGGRWEMAERDFRGLRFAMFVNEPATLADLLADATRRADPAATMTEHGDAITTYAEFHGRVAALADLLRERIAPGAHVALAMENRVEWMLAFVAIVAAGGVPVLVNSRGAGEEIDRAIRQTDCVLAIADDRCHGALLTHAAPDWPTILVNDFPVSTANTLPAFAPRRSEDPALILFSSGTTGHPKAIIHSQAGIAHALAIGRMLNDAQDLAYEAEFGPLAPHERNNASIAVVSGPMFHVNGLLPYLRAIANCGHAVLLGKWDPDRVFDLLERGGVSRLGLVPTMVFDLLASPRAAALQHLRFMGSGTALLAPATAQRMWAALPRCYIYNGYGQSETGERSATFGGSEFAETLGAVGRVVPGFRIRTIRDDGSDAEVGKPGEVVAYSACNMMGYYRDPAATAATLQSGWVKSGDVGVLDAEGRLHIVDRKKNMVISGGENIYCAEVERVLGEHPAVVEALAYGVPDPRLVERLVAHVVLKADAEEAELLAYARDRLAIYKVPRALSFTRQPLARTATGKVARGAILAALAEGKA